MADAGIPPRAESCKTCKFLGQGHPRDRYNCHRYPPQAYPVVVSRTFTKDHYKGGMVWSEIIEDRSYWPATTPDHWCGEYAPRG